MVSHRQTIEKCIESALRSFERGELAYLALTSMVERPILDRIAYQLHRAIDDRTAVAAREWSVAGTEEKIRADIALLIDRKPTLVIEGKAMNTHAVCRNKMRNRLFVDRMQADLDRLRGAHTGKAEIYTLMFAAHPRDPIPAEFFEVIKKPRSINRGLETMGGHRKLAAQADARMCQLTRPSTLAASGTHYGGRAYGIRVDLMWWLFGPFRAPGRLRLATDSP